MGIRKPKIVVIGGGTGLPVLLEGLKRYPIELTALVTVADDGGSSGEIRKKFNVPAPGDIRNVIIAMAESDPELGHLFQYRFQDVEELSGHSLGNLLLASLTEVKGSFFAAVKELSQIFNVKGKVYPMTDESISLVAEMSDGTIVNGESNIPLAKKKIKQIYLGPETPQPIPEVIEAIVEADYIIIAPGSLYTSIIPNLILPEINQACQQTDAHFIYVCNIMTQDGETTNYYASDHIHALHSHMNDNIISSIIVNNGKISQKTLRNYRRENAKVVQNDYDQLKAQGLTIIADDIVDDSTGTVRHNTGKVAKLIYQLIRS